MLADVKEWLREEPRQALALGISAVALLLSFLEVVPGPVDPAWLAVLLCGVPIIKEGAEGLFTRFDIKADVLVSLALLASVIIGEVIFIRKDMNFALKLLAIIAGAVIYRTVIACALTFSFLKATDLKIITAVIVAFALALPVLQQKSAERKLRRENAKKYDALITQALGGETHA